jgi:hypothetical protein
MASRGFLEKAEITHQTFSHLATTVWAERKLHQDAKSAEKAAADNSHSISGII